MASIGAGSGAGSGPGGGGGQRAAVALLEVLGGGTVHYRDADAALPTNHPVFLESDIYGLALDALVKCCVDILVTTRAAAGGGGGGGGDVDDGGVEERVLLSRRCVWPQKSWWFVGGRMRVGETPVESATRSLSRELGLNLSHEVAALRVRQLTVATYVWARREQPPSEHGTSDCAVIMHVELSAAEVASIVYDRGEYAELLWAPLSTLTAAAAEEHYTHHPSLHRAAKLLVAQRLWQTLMATLHADNGGGGDGTTTTAAVDYRQRLLAIEAAMPPAPRGNVVTVYDGGETNAALKEAAGG